MRLWGVPVHCMCQKHLLGEHVEMHMFKSVIERGYSVDGYVRDGLLDTDRIVERHHLVAQEMLRRRYNHTSKLNIVHYPEDFVHDRTGVVQNDSEDELARRCPDCRTLLEAHYGAGRFSHLPMGGDAIQEVAPSDYVVQYNGVNIGRVFGKRATAVKMLEDHRRTQRELERAGKGERG